MVQTEVQENGMAIVYNREIKGDEMHVVRIYSTRILLLLNMHQ